MSNFSKSNFNLGQLRRKMDISDLTILLSGINDFQKGRFYALWRNGNFIVIQAEPYCRPGVTYDINMPRDTYMEEFRAYNYIKEVIQTMLDIIDFESEHNWAHLVRQKDNTYRLVYTTKRWVQKCTIWTKVVDLDDIEVTRTIDGPAWEGIYNGKDVDLFIAWNETWGNYVSAESRGHKLMQSLGLGRYTFELLAHISKNGIIIGVMTEPTLGRGVVHSDRAAVYEAVAELQRHGLLFRGLLRSDLYITKQGVRFTNICSMLWFKDHDKLAEEAEFYHWQSLAQIFDEELNSPFVPSLSSSRGISSSCYVIPRLPSPGRPVLSTPAQAIINLAWSIAISDEWYNVPEALARLADLYRRPKRSQTTARRNKRVKGDGRALLPPDDILEKQTRSLEPPSDEPLVVTRPYNPGNRPHPYSAPRRLLLPQDDDRFETVTP
ncbi:hypothetical protein F5I97DRAFT_1931378 [Phlebopus sp. FC_14]|nr:hypothetical protein F5I97DRAFT_1931378 [Phlebopus sp. FC_14]